MEVEQHQESLTDQQTSVFDSDRNCFICKEGGYANVCSQCPRVFHSQCSINPQYRLSVIARESHNMDWVCPCCVLANVCPVCNRQVQSNEQRCAQIEFHCTVCLRRVHPQCYSYSSEISQDQRMDPSLMICMECFKMNGIEYLKQKKISNGVTYFLVKPYNVSHVHLGWITNDQFGEVIERMKRFETPKYITRYSREMETQKQIDKVLMIKPELELFDAKEFFESQSLRGRNRQIKVLVKWRDLSLQESTWQDASVLLKSEVLGERDMYKLLYKKWRNQGRVSIQRSIMLSYHLVGGELAETQRVAEGYLSEFLNNKYGCHRVEQVKEVVHPSCARELGFLMRHMYYEVLSHISETSSEFQFQQILFLTDTPQMWYRAIKQYFPQLNLVVTETNHKEDFEDQMGVELFCSGKPIFDIWFVRNEEFLSFKECDRLKFGLVVMENDVRKEKRVKQKHRDSFLLVLYEQGEILSGSTEHSSFFDKIQLDKVEREEGQNEVGVQAEEVQELDPQQQQQQPPINENSIPKSKKPILQPQEQSPLPCDIPHISTVLLNEVPNEAPRSPPKDLVTSVAAVELTEIQRIFFLRFVLEFGLQFPRFSKLFKRFLRFQPQNKLFERNLVTQVSLQNYLQQFLETLLSKAQYPYYFLEWKCSQITKRISDLSILYRIYQIFKDQPWKLPIAQQFVFATQGRTTFTSAHWSNSHDVSLIKMIMQYGYNNWQLISQNFQSLNQTKGQRGYQLLRALIWPSLQKNNKWKYLINTVVKIRANMLLGNPAFETIIKKAQSRSKAN